MITVVIKRGQLMGVFADLSDRKMQGQVVRVVDDVDGARKAAGQTKMVDGATGKVRRVAVYETEIRLREFNLI
jgi:hypothetical protein